MLDRIREQFDLSGDDPGQYSPLALAFIGDSIYGAVAKSIVVLLDCVYGISKYLTCANSNALVRLLYKRG